MHVENEQAYLALYGIWICHMYMYMYFVYMYINKPCTYTPYVHVYTMVDPEYSWLYLILYFSVCSL